MTNPMITMERMPLPHLLERLRQLAEHRSPSPPSGPVPIVLAEWCLLAEAARRLERMENDLDGHARTAKNTPEDWPYWAICNGSGRIMETTAQGKRHLLQRLEDMRRDTDERSRTWTVRPMFAGGVNMTTETNNGDA